MSASPRYWPIRSRATSTLRRSLGYSFTEAGRHIASFGRDMWRSEQLDGPLTQGMALNFVLSLRARPTAGPFVMECFAAFASISPSTTRGPKRSILAHFPGPAPFHRRAS